MADGTAVLEAPVSPQPIETERPRNVERQKEEISTLARATIRREAQRRLIGPDGTKREPQTPQEQALNVYHILSTKQEGGFSFGSEGNAITLPEINGVDQFGSGVHFDTNQASLREIVKTNDDGTFVCTFRNENGMRVTTTARNEAGEEHDVDVQVVLPREAVLDAQFLSERGLYQEAVGPDKSKLLEAHAAVLPQTAEAFIPNDETDGIIENGAAAANVLTAKEVLNSSFFGTLSQEKQAALEKRLSNSGILTPADVREVTELVGWNKKGIYERHDQIIDELKQIGNAEDPISKARKKELQEEQQRLALVNEALTPDENGRTQIDTLLEKLQNGELDDSLAKGMKEAILTGDTRALFDAMEISGNKIDGETRAKILNAAKVAGISGLALAGLLVLITGGVMAMAAQGIGNDGSRR